MKRVVLVLLSVLLLAGTANAAMVAGWDMTGQPGTQTTTPGYGSDRIAAFAMVRGEGLSPNAGSNSFNSRGWDAGNTNDYIEFGFEVADGYTVTLDELWIGTRSSATGPGTMGIYTSLDDYASPIATTLQPADTYLNSIIDFSALGPISGEFFVRLYEVGNTQADLDGATSSSGTFRIADHYLDSVYTDTHFEGTVSPVPVPGAIWLFGSALFGLLGIRNRSVQ